MSAYDIEKKFIFANFGPNPGSFWRFICFLFNNFAQ